jgi:hypothetical protein
MNNIELGIQRTQIYLRVTAATMMIITACSDYGQWRSETEFCSILFIEEAGICLFESLKDLLR